MNSNGFAQASLVIAAIALFGGGVSFVINFAA